MSEITKEEVSPKKKGTAEVAAFNEKYADALAEARVSAEHTATEGWQELYSVHQKRIEKWRRDIGTMLHEAATFIERGDLSDGPEGVIADAKKQFGTLRTTVRVFEDRTLATVKEAVERCAEVIALARRDASSLEFTSPLVAKGVLQAVESAIEKVPKVAFNEKSGQVEITDPV